jgi:hypothetical protein
MRWTELVEYMGDMRNACKILTEELIEKRPFGRSRNGWKDNIKTDLIKMVCQDMGSTHMAHTMVQWLVLEDMVINLWVP